MKPTGKTSSMPGGLAAGAGVSLGLTLGGTGLMAWLVNRELLEMEAVGYGILGMLLMASFLGAMAAFRRIRRRRMVVCLASGGVYLGMLLSITALFFGGQYSGVWTTALLILAGSLTAGLLGVRRGRGGKVQKIRIPRG